MTKSQELRESIFYLLEENEYDYHVLPHYGLISDYYERYWELHVLLLKYFSAEREEKEEAKIETTTK